MFEDVSKVVVRALCHHVQVNMSVISYALLIVYSPCGDVFAV